LLADIETDDDDSNDEVEGEVRGGVGGEEGGEEGVRGREEEKDVGVVSGVLLLLVSEF
jgi:hypothetical protein